MTVDREERILVYDEGRFAMLYTHRIYILSYVSY